MENLNIQIEEYINKIKNQCENYLVIVLGNVKENN